MIHKDIHAGAIVEGILGRRRLRPHELDKKCGWSCGRTSNLMAQTDMKFSTLVAVARACGYKIKLEAEENWNGFSGDN